MDTTWNFPRINRLMKKRGWIKKDLAKNLGYSPQLLSYYFTSPPTLKKAQRLADALSDGAEIDWRELIV